ncbi:nitrilase-related carbon-nitrogen hydrolase [Neisseria animalis]|uniref:nitrilase-related carbon-nitrogen hydrolase n=1 Tax=Neisseria animalis TaxID=492 RepID=UPI00268BACFD
MKTLRAAAIQMVSGINPEVNIRTMQRLVREAAAQGADWVLLPEYWPIMGRQDTDKLAIAETLGNGRLQNALSETARECRVTLFGGTIPLQSPDPGKVMNTLPVYNRNGELIHHYHKMHLFGFSGLSERYSEADTISAGTSVPDCRADDIKTALGTCYDLRFPEFFRAQQPFDILLLPAAFTYTTGKAHWELLLRARGRKPMLYCCRRARRHTRKRPPNIRPQHDYRPLGRCTCCSPRRRRRDYRRTRCHPPAKRPHPPARAATPYFVIKTPKAVCKNNPESKILQTAFSCAVKLSAPTNPKQICR